MRSFAAARRLSVGLVLVGMLGACEEGPSGSTATNPPSTPPDPIPIVVQGPPPDTGGGPVITMAALTHDFGAIPDVQRVSASFTFTNTGSSKLVIEEIKAGCGCTVPTLRKRQYLPGETGTIQVEFNPKGKSGTEPKKIKVIANTKPAITELELLADVRPLVRYERYHAFGRRSLGKTHRGIASLRYVDPDLIIERIAVADPNITARVVSNGVIDSASGEEIVYRSDIELTISDQMPWGTLYANTVDFDVYGRWKLDADPTRYSYKMYLTANLVGELTSSPGVASIGRLNRGDKYEKIVKIKRIDGGSFEMLNARIVNATMPGMEVRFERSPIDSTYSVILYGNTGRHVGAVRGRIVLETNVPGETLITIPISGDVV